MKKFLSKALWGLYISAALTVAGICGAGAVLFVWWRKVKLKVSTKLGIDENAKKEKEEDLVINGEDSAASAAQDAAQNPEQSAPADEPAVRQ